MSSEYAATVAAVISVTAISLAPNLILFLFPNHLIDNYRAKEILSFGQALAAGGLLGDVFLHSLPHAMEDNENGPDGFEGICISMLIGFLAFFLSDILVRSFGNIKNDQSNDHRHIKVKNNAGVKDACIAGDDNKERQENNSMTLFSSKVILNLVSDSLHNFTDGLAIGSSFAAISRTQLNGDNFWDNVGIMLRSRGGLATLSVMFHEIPHELGDFAILVNAGMSKRQAILTQFSTAIAALCGTFIGIFATMSIELTSGYQYMIPFTAGGFLYFASVGILPEILEMDVSLKTRAYQLLAFIAGLGFMYGVAIIEHNHHDHEHSHEIHHHGHHHHHEHSHEL
eukprot:CAMPEP_0184865870 /NCGR_PEP_ID=MMETSP0580-20130426/19487_1 /TAXON_ID=1118495 /ORGANISM="Dactyliosolen fragilissimus" /LENGTH=340 /DNA_ID=CAMNT_0027365245 /DNA_START=185 /DNA_END=1210 /DNA_ORIENTATION=+